MEVLSVDGLRVRQAQFAATFHLTLDEYLKIVRSCTASEVVVVLELLKTTKHRSPYRHSMHERVRRWLDLDLPGLPLSPKHFTALVPTWPVTWKLPT